MIVFVQVVYENEQLYFLRQGFDSKKFEFIVGWFALSYINTFC